jgi:AcrR family transcriptional regulator
MVATRRDTAPDVRSRVIAAATRLFAAHGFDGTALQDIADEVGLTKPAVLHHFPSKEDIRQAVLDSILTHWRDTLPRLLLAATASDQRFDTVFGEVYRFFAEAPDRARVIAREALDRPADTRRLLRGPVAPVLAAVAAYIETGRDTGTHHADVDAEAYLVHVLQLVIAAAAVADVTSTALGGEGTRRARYDREIARMAKTSLFPPRGKETKDAKGMKADKTLIHGGRGSAEGGTRDKKRRS